MMDYMLDTSAVGQIEDGDIPVELLSGSTDQFDITHVQKDELAEAGGYAENLLEVVEMVAVTEVPTESAIWGISKWGASRWESGKYFEEISEHMGGDEKNEIKDALIAEAAVCNDYVLVTHDRELRDVVNEKTPGHAISVSELRDDIS